MGRERRSKFANDAKTTADLASSLAQNMNNLSEVKLSKYKTNAVVTFIDDDGTNKFLTKWKPIADSKGIKLDVAIIKNRIGLAGSYMTLNDLKSLQTEGFNIVSHSVQHIDLDTMTETALREELKEAKSWVVDNGFGHAENVLVAPYSFSQTNVTVKNIVRDYFNYAFISNGVVHNPSPLDNYNINRTLMDAQSLTTLKGYVDEAFANNSYLVIFTHIADDNYYTEAKLQELSELIDYIKSKGIPIMTTNEALQYKGNSVFSGEYTSSNSLIIGKDGSNNLKFRTKGFSTTMDAPITDYPAQSVTTNDIKGADDPLTGQGGSLTTYRGNQYYSYQTYVTVGGVSVGNTDMYFRKWVNTDSTGAWGAWKKVSRAETALPTTPTLENSWVAYNPSHAQPRYWKDNAGQVHIEGTVALGTIGQTVFTLPVGYRPSKVLIIQSVCNEGIASVFIYTTGEVKIITGSTTWTSLNNISFLSA
jgi:peptidoglycan/xylan/chitin deacetylase (PgdA/CDA1 family)